MSYAEHGPRIFLTGGPSSDVPLTYGDYVLPKKRLEGRLKLYDSCTDIRAWSPNVLENTRYFRELNEHGKSTPEKRTPFSVVMENMITLTAQAQRDLHVTRRELLRYRSLNLTPEQRDHLKNFDRTTVETDKVEEMKIGSITRPLSQERCRLFNANKIVSSQHFDAYMWIYFRPDRFRYSRDDQPQLAHTCILKNYLNVKPLLENNAYLVSRVTSCNILPGEKATRDYNKQETFCIECVDASIQVERDIREMGVQTEECRDNDIYDKQSNIDSPSSQYYETGESTSTFESEFGINLDPESCERNHTEVIIQKDSEIIALKNELDMREDDLKDLQDLNRHLQTLLKEKDEDSNILKHNVNTLQEKLKVAKTSQDNKIADLNAKLSSVEYLMDQMKMELIRERQVCYSQSKEIRELKIKVEAAELHSMENQSLMRKVREMDRLSREAESCGDALKQMKNVCLERDMLQKQNYEQSCTLAERENEIKQLLTLIKQTSDKADTREVEMSGVVADLRNEIQAKNDKISQCEMQLVCMEREVGNLSDMLKSSLNNFDEAKIAFEGVCDYTKCEHDACLDVQSAVSALKAFVTELEECKLERRSRLQRIDNLKAYMACYSQETVGEITDTDFDTGRGSIQLAAEGVSTHTSSNGDCRSSKELVNVQIQSDDVNTVITCSENLNELKLNEIISYKDIDRALATHMKRSIDKIHEISAVLQGAGDYHVNIVNELTRQQQELRKRDLEVQEHLRKRMLEKEQMLETVINERDTKIERLRENLVALETNVSSYRVECDQLKVERADLVDARNLLLKENEEQDEELRARGNQIRKLARQIDDLKQTVDDLRGEANDIKNMKEKLTNLQMSNKDLADTLVQANETISKNNEMISKLERKDEKNRMALTHGSITYDAMITQKHSDIVKLQDENQLLRDQLEEVEIKLAQNNETIVLLKREIDNMTAINALQISLSGLDLDKERLSAKVDCLKNEIASYQNSTACVESRLQTLLHGNETLMVDIKILKSTNDQLLHPSGDTVMSTLKEALYVLPKKIYETIVHFQSEIKECDKETEGVFVEYLNKEVVEIEEINKKEKQQKKIYADKTCQQDEDLLNSIAEEVNSNFKNAAHKLKFLEGQYEEKLQEIKNLMDDVKQRDQEIKILQEYITYLLQKNNVLQTKVKCQIKEYQNKLTLQKKKYDSSLNAFRKEYNENVERLEARFKDIKYEKSSFDTENWLQSLNLKELSELHNRINILSSHAARNTESNAERIETKNSQEHRFYNKFTLRKQHPNKNRPSSKKKTSKEEFYSKYFNVENNKIAITELYCKDSKLERKHSSSVNEKKLPGNTESPKPKTNRSLDWQREKFIYQCSMHYKLNNAR